MGIGYLANEGEDTGDNDCDEGHRVFDNSHRTILLLVGRWNGALADHGYGLREKGSAG